MSEDVKAFPLQMPAPLLTRLLEPYGNFSPMGVLWYSIGASFPYERFTGIVEVVGGRMLPANQQEIRSGLAPGAQVVRDALVLQNTVDQ